VEEEVVAMNSGLALAVTVAVAWVMVIEMVDESVMPAATAPLKADCPRRTIPPPDDSAMAQAFALLVPVGLVRLLSCNPEKASYMRQFWLSAAED
jgi:hypothetical protein